MQLFFKIDNSFSTGMLLPKAPVFHSTTPFHCIDSRQPDSRFNFHLTLHTERYTTLTLPLVGCSCMCRLPFSYNVTFQKQQSQQISSTKHNSSLQQQYNNQLLMRPRVEWGLAKV